MHKGVTLSSGSTVQFNTEQNRTEQTDENTPDVKRENRDNLNLLKYENIFVFIK